MPNEIKTRSTIKSIKAIDKTVNIGVRMKKIVIRSKQNAESTQETDASSPSEYASDYASEHASGLTQTAAYRTKTKLRHPLNKASNNFKRAKEHFRMVNRQRPKERQKTAEQARYTAEQSKNTVDALGSRAQDAQKAAEQTKTRLMETKRSLQQTRHAGRQSIQTAKQTVRAGKGMKTSAKSVKATGKGTIKTVKKSVKTSERAAKVTVKTALHTAKKAQQTARATARSARIAARASRVAAKTAVKSAKVATRIVIAMIKAAIAAIKGLVAIIAAGGWIAVLIIIIICLIGLLVSSVFGVFFSGETSSTGRSMPAVVSELTDEFYQKIEDIKIKYTHDVEDITPMSIHWAEVLSIYAVKVNTDPDNPDEVATLDDDKVKKLRSVLNDMVSLSHSLVNDVKERIATDEEGNESSETVTVITLVITLTHKNADDMAIQYGFIPTQNEMLNELLSPEYTHLWSALFSGTSIGNGEIGIPDGSHNPQDIFSWPIAAGFRISSTFGYRKDPFTGNTKYHGGIDIAAPDGTPILAMADGTVITANATDSNGGGYGYHVKLRHNDSYVTVYAHCSRLAVANGQEVKKGQVIAYVGSTGRSTGNHLHFEVWKDGARTDPSSYFLG